MNILMVLTSHDTLGNTGNKTGFWLEEFAAPYYVFRDAGVQLTLASPKGWASNHPSTPRVIPPKVKRRPWRGSKRTRRHIKRYLRPSNWPMSSRKILIASS